MNRKISSCLPMLFVTAGLFGAAGNSSKNTKEVIQDCAPLCYATPLLECESPWEITGAAIYQQFRTQAQEVAIISQDTAGAPFRFTDQQALFSFAVYPLNANGVENSEDFGWGGRIGIGYRTWYDDWKVNVRYTYLKITTNNSNQNLNYGLGYSPSAYANQAINGQDLITSPNLPASGQPISARQLFRNLDWGVSTIFNDLNFTLSRPTKISKDLELTTFVGFDVSFFTRRANPVFTNGFNNTYSFSSGLFYQNYQKMQWWGVGPMLGLHSSWYLAYDWSFYGDAYTSLQYGLSSSRTATFSRTNNSVTNREATVTNFLYTYSPNYSFALGFSWMKILEEFETKITFNIGYETSYYSQVIKPVTPELAYKTTNGSGLGIQGLILQGVVDF